MKIRWNIDTGYVQNTPGWELDIPDEDLEHLSPSQIEDVIGDYVHEEMMNTIFTHWTKVD